MNHRFIQPIALALLVVSLLAREVVTAQTEPPRTWTPTATGKGQVATLIRKSADNSRIVVKLPDGREVTLKTNLLAKEDQEYVKNADLKEAEVQSKGIVRGRAGGPLSQASGGKSRVMRDLQAVLADYGTPIEDTKANPDAVIYSGPAWFNGGGPITVPYLMPRVQALELLVPHPGLASKRPAVAPGFPPGMIIYEYDIRFGVYNRMFVLVDQADQVVALQAKAETTNDPRIPDPIRWRHIDLPMNSTSDFIEPRTGGASAFVLDLRKEHRRIIIDLETGGMETVLYLPEPMINLCLFHLAQDIRN